MQSCFSEINLEVNQEISKFFIAVFLCVVVISVELISLCQFLQTCSYPYRKNTFYIAGLALDGINNNHNILQSTPTFHFWPCSSVSSSRSSLTSCIDELFPNFLFFFLYLIFIDNRRNYFYFNMITSLYTLSKRRRSGGQPRIETVPASLGLLCSLLGLKQTGTTTNGQVSLVVSYCFHFQHLFFMNQELTDFYLGPSYQRLTI